MSDNKQRYEVIIVGGSYAGLAAAMTLGRALRKVLVIDAGQPCNQYAPTAHNFPGFDGETPQFIRDKILDQVRNYTTVEFFEGKVTSISGTDMNFEVVVDKSTSFKTNKILLATGVTDILPEINGFKECWGKSAIHCPYCHGYEVAQSKVAVFAHGQAALQMSKLIRQWSTEIHILTNGHEDFNKDELQELHELGTRVITKELQQIVSNDGMVSKIIFSDDTEEAIDAIYVRVGIKQSNSLAKDLGCDFDDHGFVIVDNHNKTKIDGVYAAGDIMSGMRSLAIATAAGTKVGIFMNKELIENQ